MTKLRPKLTNIEKDLLAKAESRGFRPTRKQIGEMAKIFDGRVADIYREAMAGAATERAKRAARKAFTTELNDTYPAMLAGVVSQVFVYAGN